MLGDYIVRNSHANGSEECCVDFQVFNAEKKANKVPNSRAPPAIVVTQAFIIHFVSARRCSGKLEVQLTTV